MIGRGHDANLQVDDPAVSRCHARVTRSSEGRFSIEDLTAPRLLGAERNRTVATQPCQA